MHKAASGPPQASHRELEHAESHRQLALCARERGDDEVAGEHFRTSLQLAPMQDTVWVAWGMLLIEQGRWDEAMTVVTEGLHYLPDDAALQFYMGNLCYRSNRVEEAVTHFECADMQSPDNPAILSNLGLARLIDNHVEAAAITLERALLLKPDSIDAQLSLGRARMELGDVAAAEQCFERALVLDPDHVVTRFNLGHLALLRGNFVAGWDGFAYRAQQPGQVPHLRFSQPQWDGRADLAGKTILLYSEQGYGDTSQFIRYAIMVAALGAHVIAAVPASMLTLIVGCPGIAEVMDLGLAQEAPSFDFHLPMMSLPQVFATEVSTIPTGIPYLHCAPERLLHWHNALGSSQQLRVGLVWSGGTHKDVHQSLHSDRSRSMRFDQFLPFLEVPGAEFHSLQIGPDAQAQAKGNASLIDHATELYDFQETAALIEQLDLIISVDTAVAHLAGGLGKPVWMLNRYNSCWRWMLDRNDSPWYPDMRIFRQPAPGDWNSVITEVTTALGERVQQFDRCQ